MAYFIPEHMPAPMYYQPEPPPVVFQPAPAPVYVEPAIAVIQAPDMPVVMRTPMKSNPVSVKCNLCQQQVVTMTKPVNGLLTWIVFGVLFALFIWPFCLIPFCVKSCKDVRHTCPNCQNVIHVHKRM